MPFNDDWERIKLRTALYEIKCCPSCGGNALQERATGPRWVCRTCHVSFVITNPSRLTRRKKVRQPIIEEEVEKENYFEPENYGDRN